MSNNELVTRHTAAVPGAPGSQVAGVPVRATRVASWIGWHLAEISGVTVPAVIAVVGTPWWWLVTGVVGAGWTAHGIRVTQARRGACVTNGGGGADGTHQVGSVTTAASPDESSGVDSERAGGVR